MKGRHEVRGKYDVRSCTRVAVIPAKAPAASRAGTLRSPVSLFRRCRLAASYEHSWIALYGTTFRICGQHNLLSILSITYISGLQVNSSPRRHASRVVWATLRSCFVQAAGRVASNTLARITKCLMPDPPKVVSELQTDNTGR